jgi:hypothetical protein
VTGTYRLIVAIAISIILMGAVIATPEDEKVNITVTLDQKALKGKAESVTGAWMGYGIARANWISEHVLGNPETAKAYRRCFEEELAGRENLAKIWSELKHSDPKLKDDYLDQVIMIRGAGFLGEYVWSYLGSADWKQPPKQLRLEAFDKWKASNLSGHKAETFADVKIEPKTP